MALHSHTNQYPGINAHLHSYLQSAEGGWEVFHATHIIHLAEVINRQLPPGYVVDPERSMQIRHHHPDTGEPLVWKPRPDVTIYEREFRRGEPATVATPTTPTLRRTAIASVDVLDEQSFLRAVVIREIDAQGQIGKPITWIELLSPTNKPPNSGYLLYREKRNTTLHSQLVLVEIDYLHETRSPVPLLASYPDGEPDAFPYSIVVTDPRPSLEEGMLAVYSIAVDEPLPTILIPLAGNDSLTLDMNAVYHHSFSSLTSFSVRVDYEQLPRNFERYTPADQKRIWERMQAAQRTLSTEQ